MRELESRIEKLETECDEILHEVYKRLNQTFITPLDPEDIQSLCSHLNDVMDGIEEATHCIVSYKIDPIPAPIVEICKLLVECAAEVKAAVEVMDKNREIVKHCIEINRLENESDRLCRTLIAQLFDEEKDSVQIIKWKEIYETMENAIDRCEDVANVLEGIALKNTERFSFLIDRKSV